MQQEQDSSWSDYSDFFDEATSDVDTSSTPEGWGMPSSENVEDGSPGNEGFGGSDDKTSAQRGLQTLKDIKNYAIGDESTTKDNETHEMQYEMNRLVDPIFSFGSAYLGKKTLGTLGNYFSKGSYITRPIGFMGAWKGYELGEELLKDTGLDPYVQSGLKGAAGLTAYEGSIWAASKGGQFATSQITNFAKGTQAYGEAAKIIMDKTLADTGSRIEARRATGKLTEGFARKLRRDIPGHVSVELGRLNQRIPDYVMKKLNNADKKLYKNLKDVITDKNFYSRMIKFVGQKSPKLVQKWAGIVAASTAATGSTGVGNVVGPLIGVGLNMWLAADVLDYAMSEEGGEFYNWVYGELYPESMLGKGAVYGEAAKKGNVPVVDRTGVPLPGKDQPYGWNPEAELKRKKDAMREAGYKLPPMGSEIVTGDSINDWLQESGIVE